MLNYQRVNIINIHPFHVPTIWIQSGRPKNPSEKIPACTTATEQQLLLGFRKAEKKRRSTDSARVSIYHLVI
jgi:hypothetical protein